MSVAALVPLLDAVEDVISDGAGVARTIATGHRFRRGPYPGQTKSEQGTEAAVQKGAYASIVGARPMAGPEMHSVLMYTLTVRLDLFYHLPAPRLHDDFRDALAEAAGDMHRLRMALGYPSNLLTNAAGEATGLSGGALQFESWSMSDPDPEARLLRASMRLIGRVNMTA